MNKLITYVKSPLVTLSRFEHSSSEPHYDPPEEMASYYSINFIERGDYGLQIGRRKWQIVPGLVFNTVPDLSFRCSHADEFPQCVCFSVRFEGHFADGLAREGFKPGRLAHVAPVNNRLAYLHLRLRRLCACDGEVMMAETLAGDLLTAVIGTDFSRPQKLHRGNQLSWYVERIEAARALIEAQYGAPHTLASLARFTGMSPFHFARVFRELIGTPPHRYLLRTRLARASEQLRAGAGVTETCFSCGFTNLSHFIRSFRRAYGQAPSRLTKNEDVNSRPRRRPIHSSRRGSRLSRAAKP